MKQYHYGAVARLAEQVIKMACQLGAIVLLARYIDQESLGVVLLAQTLTTLFMFLNQLGLNAIFVKGVVAQEVLPVKRYFSSCIAARYGAAIFCFVAVNLVAFFFYEQKYFNVFWIFSLAHFFMPFTSFNWYFEAIGESLKTSVAVSIASLISFALKAYVAIFGLPIEYLAGAYLAEFIVVGFLNVILARKMKLIALSQVSKQVISGVLKKSYPLIFSGALSLLYMKVDQLMLGKMLGEEDVAEYVAATRLSEAWIFVGITLVSVYYPMILKQRNISEIKYINSIISHAKWIIWFSIALSVGTMLIAEPLVHILYGEQYKNSASILAITIWTVPFTYLGAIASRMYINDENQGVLFWRSLLGVVINVVANYLLIPRIGGFGAGVATVLSQFAVGFLFNFNAQGMHILKAQLRSIVGLQKQVVV